MIHMHIDQVFFVSLIFFQPSKVTFFFLSEKYYFDWSLFIAVKKDKNKDYNMCISQSHLLQEFFKFYEEFLLKKLDDFGILQEFFMNSSLWEVD